MRYRHACTLLMAITISVSSLSSASAMADNQSEPSTPAATVAPSSSPAATPTPTPAAPSTPVGVPSATPVPTVAPSLIPTPTVATVESRAAARAAATACPAWRKLPKGGRGHPVKAIKMRNIVISAHGGAPSTARHIPFDSIPAERNAHRLCANLTESDYRLTRDRVLIDHHDEYFGQNTNCSLDAFAWPWHRLAKCRYNGTRVHVSRLKTDLDAIETWACTSMGKQIELKHVQWRLSDIKGADGSLKKHHLRNCSLVTAGERHTDHLQRVADPKIQTGWILRTPNPPSMHSLRSAATRRNVDYIMLDKMVITKPYVKKLHALGYRVSARIINTVAQFVHVARCRVDEVVVGQHLRQIVDRRERM